jgi:Tfp pilus assembly protein PilF
MDFFNRAVKGDPQDARAYYGIGRIFASNHKREMAAENFSKALRLEKDADRKNQIMNELFQLGQVGD